MKTNFYKVITSYNGSFFSGWQAQENKKSVQDSIEATLLKLWGFSQKIKASSRTDAGVHAYGQVVKIKLPSHYSEAYLKKVLNDHVAKGIFIRSLERCEEGFCPRRNAQKKLYYYTFSLNQLNVFISPFVSRYFGSINETKIQEYCNIFVGTHDFSSFATIEKGEIKNPVKTIYAVNYIKINDSLFQIQIEGDGFLKYMVRRLVGGILTSLSKGYTTEHLKNILTLCNPSHDLITMPPQGLMLIDISFDSKPLVYYDFKDIVLQ